MQAISTTFFLQEAVLCSWSNTFVFMTYYHFVVVCFHEFYFFRHLTYVGSECFPIPGWFISLVLQVFWFLFSGWVIFLCTWMYILFVQSSVSRHLPMVVSSVSCWAGVYRCLRESLISALLSSSPELGFLGHLVVLVLMFQCTPSLFSILALPTSHSYNSEGGFQSLNLTHLWEFPFW